MKKVILFIMAAVLLISCYQHEAVERKCVVEEKYECPAGYMIWISDINNPAHLHRIEVGKHTYENSNPGDTLIVKW